MVVSRDVFVGIDVSKDRLDVHVRPLGVGFSVSNEAAGVCRLDCAAAAAARETHRAGGDRKGMSGRCGWR
jgi:hypothetical protein